MSHNNIRGLFTILSLCCTLTSFAQFGEWIADQIKEQIYSEIGKITNYNSKNLGSFGNYLWDSVVESMCESDLHEKAQEFKRYEIDRSHLNVLPNKYTNREMWTSYPQISSYMYAYANTFFHQGKNMRFSEVAGASIDTLHLNYIDSLTTLSHIESLDGMLSNAVLDSLRLFTNEVDIRDTLLKDIQTSPNIAYILNNHPEAVRVYANSLSSPMLRKNAKHLLYWGVNADVHRHKLNNTKKPLLDPRTLVFTQTPDGVEVYNGTYKVALLDGDELEVFDVNIMNLYGRPNTTYVFNNNTWITDENGRVTWVEQLCNKTFKKKCKQKSILNSKNIMALMGDMSTKELLYLNSLEYGAPEVLLNTTLFDKSKPNKNTLKKIKKVQKTQIKKAKEVAINKALKYVDNSQMPATITADTHTLQSEKKPVIKSPTDPVKTTTNLSGFLDRVQPSYKTNFFNASGVSLNSTSSKAAESAMSESKSKDNSSVDRNSKFVPMTGSGHYTLKGKIDDKYAVTLNITLNTGAVEGTYYYDKYHKTMRIDGRISSRGEMTLTEYENSSKTGQYEGKFDGKSFIGKFTNKRNVTMPFHLKVQ